MSDVVQGLMARRPTKPFRAELSKATKEEFAERGFTKVNRITSDEEIEWLREVYDVLFEGAVGAYVVRDVMTRIDRQRGDRVGQIIRPEQYLPQLKETEFWKNSRRLAAELLGLDEAEMDGWGHMVRKAPNDDEALPYHQDEAFWDPHFDYRSLGVWMPLDPATVESGCMSLCPGSHLEGIREHKLGQGDPAVTYIEMIDPAAGADGPAPDSHRRRLLPPLPHDPRLRTEPFEPSAPRLHQRMAGRAGAARDAQGPPLVVPAPGRDAAPGARADEARRRSDLTFQRRCPATSPPRRSSPAPGRRWRSPAWASAALR